MLRLVFRQRFLGSEANRTPLACLAHLVAIILITTLAILGAEVEAAAALCALMVLLLFSSPPSPFIQAQRLPLIVVSYCLAHLVAILLITTLAILGTEVDAVDAFCSVP